MLIPSVMNHSAALSASSGKDAVSGRGSQGAGPEEVSSFGNLLAKEVGERKTPAAPENPEHAPEIDRPERHGAELPDETGTRGAGTIGVDRSPHKETGVSESVERKGADVDPAAVAGLTTLGANGQAMLPEPKADSQGERADTNALRADQRLDNTADMPSPLLPQTEHPLELVTGQTDRTGPAATGEVSFVANLAGTMRNAIMEQRTAVSGEMAGRAGMAEAAASVGVESGRILQGQMAPGPAHSMMATPGTRGTQGAPSGKPVHIDMADSAAAAPHMEPALRDFGLMEAVPDPGSGPGPAGEERFAANSTAVHGSLPPAVERSLAVPAGTAAVADLPQIGPRIGAAGWDQALGQKVMWLLSQHQQIAELSLNPPDLGPLQVVLKMADDQLSATFVSQQADVRNALEAALPRLKEMMSESGINLSSTTVSSGSSQQQGGFERSPHAPAGGGYRSGDEPGAGLVSRQDAGAVRPGSGLVDTFA